MSNRHHTKNNAKQPVEKKITSQPVQSKKDDNDVASLKKRGDECYQRKQYKEAIKWYEKALDSDSGVKQIWLNKGLCYKELKNERDAAVVAFRKAIELDPLYAKAVYNLASMFYREPQKALEIIEAYKKEGGNDKEVLVLEEEKKSEVLAKNISPESTVAMLKMMGTNIQKIANTTNTLLNVSKISQEVLSSTKAPDRESVISLGTSLEKLGQELGETVTNAQQELNAKLSEAVDATTPLKDAKCYWMVSSLDMTGEHIARNLASFIYKKGKPKVNINCFDSEEEAKKALSSVFESRKNKNLSGFIFVGNVTSDQFESLFKKGGAEMPSSETLSGIIEGWNEYQYADNGLVLRESRENNAAEQKSVRKYF